METNLMNLEWPRMVYHKNMGTSKAEDGSYTYERCENSADFTVMAGYGFKLTPESVFDPEPAMPSTKDTNVEKTSEDVTAGVPEGHPVADEVPPPTVDTQDSPDSGPEPKKDAAPATKTATKKAVKKTKKKSG